MYIQGIDVKLYTTEKNGVDEFGVPVLVETPVTVSNVLVGQPKSEEIADSISLYGKRLVYMLSIPKGDTNEWENKTVEIYGKKFHTFGSTIMYMEHITPLSWNKQIRVEEFEEWQKKSS